MLTVFLLLCAFIPNTQIYGQEINDTKENQQLIMALSSAISEKVIRYVEENDGYAACRLVAESLPEDPSNPDKPYNNDAEIAIRQAAANCYLGILKGHEDKILDMSFSSDGRRLVTASDDYTVRVWDVRTGRELCMFLHDYAERAVFSPDGEYVFSYDDIDEKAFKWNLKTKEKTDITEQGFPEDTIESVNGVMLKVEENKVFVIDAVSGSSVGLPCVYEDKLKMAHLSKDGKYILAVTERDLVVIFDFPTRELIDRFGVSDDADDEVVSVAYDSESNFIITATRTETNDDDFEGKYLYTIKYREWYRDTPKRYDLHNVTHSFRYIQADAVTFSPDYDYFALSSSNNVRIYEFMWKHKSQFRPLSRSMLIQETLDTEAGRIAGCGFGDISICELEPDYSKGEDLSLFSLNHEMDSDFRKYYKVAFSPDGKYIATASTDSICLWDGSNASLIYSHKFKERWFAMALSFSPDSKQLAVLSNYGLYTINNLSGKPKLKNFPKVTGTIYSTCMAYSPDGNTLIYPFHYKTIQTVNLGTGKCELLETKNSHRYAISSIAFSPDGNRLLTSSADKSVRQWDVKTGEEVGKRLVHNDIVKSAFYSPDGQYIVSAADNGEVSVWNANTGTRISIFYDTNNLLDRGGTFAKFSKDGEYIYSAGDNGISKWDFRNLRTLMKELKERFGKLPD